MTLWTVPTRLLCPWDFPGKNTGVGSISSSISPTKGLNPSLQHLHWQAHSLPLSHLGSPLVDKGMWCFLHEDYVTLDCCWLPLTWTWILWFLQYRLIIVNSDFHSPYSIWPQSSKPAFFYVTSSSSLVRRREGEDALDFCSHFSDQVVITDS